MLMEILVLKVFSVDVEKQKMVVTNMKNGAIHIVYVDDSTKYERDIFNKSFHRLLNSEAVNVKVDGILDENGDLKAKKLDVYDK